MGWFRHTAAKACALPRGSDWGAGTAERSRGTS